MFFFFLSCVFFFFPLSFFFIFLHFPCFFLSWWLRFIHFHSPTSCCEDSQGKQAYCITFDNGRPTELLHVDSKYSLLTVMGSCTVMLLYIVCFPDAFSTICPFLFYDINLFFVYQSHPLKLYIYFKRVSQTKTNTLFQVNRSNCSPTHYRKHISIHFLFLNPQKKEKS